MKIRDDLYRSLNCFNQTKGKMNMCSQKSKKITGFDIMQTTAGLQ